MLLLDLKPSMASFRDAMVSGLESNPKRLPCRFFYDLEGSRLFDRICALDEYYPTRTEAGIFRERADEIATLVGPRSLLLELGSGSSWKTEILLDELEDPVAYVPVDITRRHLLSAAERIARRYPRLEVRPVCADYTTPFDLPVTRRTPARLIVFFPGSTLGNFEPEAGQEFLRQIRMICGPEGGILLGVDLKKERAILERAYNDAAGVTAAFNKNILARANRELEADFDLEHFGHYAFYNSRAGRVEMHLVSLQDQCVTVADTTVFLAENEHVITEYSYKYSPTELRRLARRACLVPRVMWTDPDRLFSVHYLTTNPDRW